MGYGNANLKWTEAENGETYVDFALIEHGQTNAGAVRIGFKFEVAVSSNSNSKSPF
jgi:hypothetical protein